jgi:hypothetical protein
MILVRTIFQAKWGKGGEFAAAMKESVQTIGGTLGPLGALKVRILTDLSGEFNVVVFESVHESLTAWEQFRARMFSTPEFQASSARSEGLVVSGRQEYWTIELEAGN